MEKSLPAIPAKRYFTIGEVSELCGVKPYVLRYWEQEFTQLKPMKRRGNRRYYQHHEVLLIRRIRELLYEQGFTISGARNRLVDGAHGRNAAPDLDGYTSPAVEKGDEVQAVRSAALLIDPVASVGSVASVAAFSPAAVVGNASANVTAAGALSPAQMRQELISIRGLLSG
ncbi:MAG: MerR family transcriptional regulator [Caldimonas sp.]